MGERPVPRPRNSEPGPSGPPYALVSILGERRLLVLENEVTIGRGRTCDLRIADNPVDDHVSRLAASVRALEDCVLIRNESASKSITLRPLVGSERPIGPQEAITSLPHLQFAVIVTGRFGTEYAVHVDVRGLTPAARARPVPDLQAPTTVSSPPVTLTPAQRRVLTALCEPLLTRAGPQASPATYRQIGERVGLRPGYVRNILKQLREQLAGQGVAAMVAFRLEQVNEDFRLPLANWALHSGTITADDLAGLNDADT